MDIASRSRRIGFLVRAPHRTKTLRPGGSVCRSSACQALLEAGNPPLYEVYEHRRPEVAGELLSGLSILHPGRVGNEFYMTKGHYHAVRATAEIYYCREGRGALLMENESGETAVEEFFPGRVVYVTPGWAHRSVNTGQQDLVTFFVYPANAGMIMPR